MHISDLAHLIQKARDAVDALERIASSMERIAQSLENLENFERDDRGYDRRD